MKYSGIIHFHSQCSYDSIFRISAIAKKAIKNSLNFLMLTDHNTIGGSLALRDYIQKKNLKIEVPIAAEYCTEFGDIIAAFIDQEIEEMSFNGFVEQVRKQNGLILFPHPFKCHSQIEKIAEVADMIEIFNSRNRDADDLKAAELAKKYGKKVYYGSDIHLSKNFPNVIIEVGQNGNLKESLLKSEIISKKLDRVNRTDVIVSQLIKRVKKYSRIAYEYTHFRPTVR